MVSITKFLIVIGHLRAISCIIGMQSHGCPITAIQLQLFVIGHICCACINQVHLNWFSLSPALKMIENILDVLTTKESI